MMTVGHLSDCLGRVRDRKSSDRNEENTPTISLFILYQNFVFLNFLLHTESLSKDYDRRKKDKFCV